MTLKATEPECTFLEIWQLKPTLLGCSWEGGHKQGAACLTRFSLKVVHTYACAYIVLGANEVLVASSQTERRTLLAEYILV